MRSRVRNKRGAAKKFGRGAGRTHRKNVRIGPMRGGIRL